MEISVLEELEKKVNEARARNEKLKAIKKAKIDLLKLKLGNRFAGFAAHHPYLTTAAEQAGRTGLELGRTAGQAGLNVGKALYKYANQNAAKPRNNQKYYLGNDGLFHPIKKKEAKSIEGMKAELTRLKLQNQLKRERKLAVA